MPLLSSPAQDTNQTNDANTTTILPKDDNEDYDFMCPVSLDIMHDPVVLDQSGNSYDKEFLCQSLLAHPHLDPKTNVRFDKPLSYSDNEELRTKLVNRYGSDQYKPFDDSSFQSEYKKKLQQEQEEKEAFEVNAIRSSRIKKLICCCCVLVIAVLIGIVILSVFKPFEVDPYQDATLRTLRYRVGQVIFGKSKLDGTGTALALSDDGKVVAVGAPQAGSSINYIRGRVDVYHYNETAESWNQRGQELIGASFADFSQNEFGKSISLSTDGDILAVSYKYSNGTIFIFRYDVEIDRWNQHGKNRPSVLGDENNTDISFTDVQVSFSSSGSILAVCGNANSKGFVTIWQYDANMDMWEEMGAHLVLDGEDIVRVEELTLSSDGYTLALGIGNVDIAKGYDINIEQTINYKFDEEINKWQQIGQALFGATALFESYRSVALSHDGDIVAIGVGGYDEYSGQVQVWSYANDTNRWEQLGQALNVGRFGSHLDLSGDGKTLAVGEPFGNRNGLQAGLVRVFRYHEGWWMQAGFDIAGMRDFEEASTVAMSSDGSFLAVGAKETTSSAGHVRVFNISSWETTVVAG